MFKNQYLYPSFYTGILHEGMDINILSISPNTVISNKKAYYVNDILSKNKFDIIEIELDYCCLEGYIVVPLIWIETMNI